MRATIATKRSLRNFLRPAAAAILLSAFAGWLPVIIVVYDEDERAGGLAQKNGFGEGGHVACAILSGPAVAGDANGDFYHYSLLRALEDGFGLSGYVGYANDVTPISGIWHGGSGLPDQSKSGNCAGFATSS